MQVSSSKGHQVRVGFVLALGVMLVSTLLQPALGQSPKAPDDVTFYGNPRSPISGGVVIPANRASVWTSGTVPAVADENAARDSRERYGDTYTQAASVLDRIEGQLKEQGLSMKDVVYIRAYLVGDPENEGRIDMQGWSKAFGEVFGTDENPTKPARSTVGVAALVVPNWLIEIEAFAVFPE